MFNPFRVFNTTKHLHSLLHPDHTEKDAKLSHHPAQASHAAPHQTDGSMSLREVFHGSDAIIEAFRHRSDEIAKTGTTDGTRNIPAHDAEHCHAEKEIGSAHDSAAMGIKHHLSATEAALTNKITTLKEDMIHPEPLEHFQNQVETQKREQLAAAAKKIAPASWDADLLVLIQKHRTVHGVLTGLREQWRQLKEQKGHAETLYQNILVNQYHRIPPLKKLIDRPIFFWGVICILFLLEITVNFTAFQSASLGGNNWGALVLGIFFAAAQAWFAKASGFAWRKQEKKRFKFFAALTVTCCLILGFFRLNMEEVLLTKGIYVIINLIIAVLTGILAFIHARHHDFFAIQQHRYALSTRIENKQYQIEEIERNHQQAREVIEWTAEFKAKEMAKNEQQQLKRELGHHESNLAALQAHHHECLHRLATIQQDAINHYRQLNQDARKDSGHDLVKHWQHLNGTTHGHGNGLHHAFSVILLALFGLMGCSHPVQEATHIEVLIDQTDTTYAQDVEPLLNYVLSFVPWDTLNGHWGEITVTLSSIGETSTQPVRTVELVASKPYWGRTEQEHRKRPAKFKAELRQTLSELTQPGNGMNHSYIHRNFYYRLDALTHQKGRRIMLSWSDLILNSPEVNLYEYREHPELIWEHRDSLISLMTGHYTLPDSAGIKLVNIHQPSKLNDELHEACKRYFSYYWEKLGIEVEFITNIPGHPAPIHHPSEGHITDQTGIGAPQEQEAPSQEHHSLMSAR